MKRWRWLGLLALWSAVGLAQSAQFGPYRWNASASGVPSQFPVPYPASVDTLGITVSGIQTAASWTIALQVGPTASGPWTTCSTVTLAANATVTQTCQPQGSAYLQVTVTAGSGGGYVTGTVFGQNSKIGSLGAGLPTATAAGQAPVSTGAGTTYTAQGVLPLTGGTLSGNLTVQQSYAALESYDTGGTLSSLILWGNQGEDDWHVDSSNCGQQLNLRDYNVDSSYVLSLHGSGLSPCASPNAGSWAAVANLYASQTVQSASFSTVSNCSSAASPAACGSAASGTVAVPAAATALVVDDAAVTANSEILVSFDASLGTKLGVTCNTTFTAPYIAARTAGASFTIGVVTAPSTNPACLSYSIRN